MKKVTASIIGGTNGMGRWLAGFLEASGHKVHVTGRKTEMTAARAAQISDVVVVAVPIAATAGVISGIGPLLKKGQLLMDLTSLKKEPLELMLAHCAADVVGCHPLFGPVVSEPAGHVIVLCRGRGESWFNWVKDIFKSAGYDVLERTPDEHDRIMSVVQALNHLNTIALGMAVAQSGIPPEEINLFATPAFRAKMDMVRKVLTESPELYADIIDGSPHLEHMLDIYEKVIRDIRAATKKGGACGLRQAVEMTAKALFR